MVSFLSTVDCWDGQDGEPIVHHGYTLTSKILFKDVIETINKYAFVKNEYVQKQTHTQTLAFSLTHFISWLSCSHIQSASVDNVHISASFCSDGNWQTVMHVRGFNKPLKMAAAVWTCMLSVLMTAALHRLLDGKTWRKMEEVRLGVPSPRQ